MRRHLNLSIYYKINGMMIAMLLLLGCIMSVIMFQSTSRILDQEVEQKGIQVAEYIGVLSSNDVLLDDRYALFDLLNKAKNNSKDVRYIFITDSAGRLLAHTFGDLFPQGLAASTLQVASGVSPEGLPQAIKLNSNEGPIRELIVPIENGTIGFVHVGMSESRTQALLTRRIFELVLTTIAICLVAAAAATYLARFIIQPLRSLAEAADQIRHGNLAVQANIEEQDEVGHLARVFNEMTLSLREKESENNRLLQELRNKEALRTELMNKLIYVQEEERKRISREIHDETGQSLTSLLAYMKVLFSKLTDDRQRELLLGAREVAVHVLGGLRKLGVELRPPILDDLGISAAIEKYLHTFRAHYGIAVLFVPPDSKALIPNDVSLALYRILQESLTNIVRHASATAVTVSLTVTGDHVMLLVADNGIGMDLRVLAAAQKEERLGVYGMRERAELIGGKLEFDSAPGQGTTICVTVPIDLWSDKDV